MSNFEKLYRRLFLRGLALTSAGLVVPRALISIPEPIGLALAYCDRDPQFINHVTYKELDDIASAYGIIRLPATDYQRSVGRLYK